jgi:UDP-N-acetylmuramate--alanine ligase
MFDNKVIHMIGIGGISMSGIASILLTHNAKVTGSDMQESETTKMLINEGINVTYGHNLDNVKKANIVVYTAAIKDDDPELKLARELKKEVYERAEFLGKLSLEYKNCLCISGTHGKSTTTGLLSTIFIKANLNPTILIGAMMPLLNNKNYKVGNKDYLIMEACEYVDSFLHFHPTSEIVLNIDNDHLDYFHNLDNIKKSFKKYTELLPENGILVTNNDDENSHELQNTNRKVITYGINNNAIYMAKNIIANSNGTYSFDIYYNNNLLTNITLNIQGYHNIYNSLASFALAYEYIKDIDLIKEGIESYHGVERRFELLGTIKNNILVYDDYAHHPTEVETTLKTAKNIKCHESWAVFQSHTYSRTAEHYKRFASILSNFDHVVIAKIYPAREINTFGITEDMIVNEIKKTNPNVIYIPEFNDIVTYLEENVKDNDLIITIGAGPVNKVSQELVKKNTEQNSLKK